jgi:NCAIR mutase (PurE)-related protein
MLNSCASGVSVMNIDNGFGAGYMAAMINDLAVCGGTSDRWEDVDHDE